VVAQGIGGQRPAAQKNGLPECVVRLHCIHQLRESGGVLRLAGHAERLQRRRRTGDQACQVACRAVETHAELVHAGQRQVLRHPHDAHRQSEDVQREDRFRRGIVQHAVGQHRLRPVQRFLGRLEDELHRPTQVGAQPGQHFRRAQSDGHMRIVTTSMFDPQGQRAIRRLQRVRDGQGVHVGPIGHDRPRLPAFQQPDDAIAADAFCDAQSQVPQVCGDGLRRLRFFAGKLWHHSEGAAHSAQPRAQRFGLCGNRIQG